MNDQMNNDVNNEVEDDEIDLPLTTPVEKKNLMTRDLRKQLSKLPSKSAQIRYLHARSWSTGDIARVLTEHYGKQVRYQHVRNIIVTPVKNPK